MHKNKVYQNKDVDKPVHDQGPSEPASQTILPNTRIRNMVLIDEDLLARFPSMTSLNERIPKKNPIMGHVNYPYQVSKNMAKRLKRGRCSQRRDFKGFRNPKRSKNKVSLASGFRIIGFPNDHDPFAQGCVHIGREEGMK